jgi:hypothetical protein
MFSTKPVQLLLYPHALIFNNLSWRGVNHMNQPLLDCVGPNFYSEILLSGIVNIT